MTDPQAVLHSFPVSTDSALVFSGFFFKHLSGEGFGLQQTKPQGLPMGLWVYLGLDSEWKVTRFHIRNFRHDYL